MVSVFQHRRSLLQSYAKAHLETRFPQIGTFLDKIKSFQKPDDRKQGQFCLLCFIEKIDEQQIMAVDVVSMSEAGQNLHVENIFAILNNSVR